MRAAPGFFAVTSLAHLRDCLSPNRKTTCSLPIPSDRRYPRWIFANSLVMYTVSLHFLLHLWRPPECNWNKLIQIGDLKVVHRLVNDFIPAVRVTTSNQSDAMQLNAAVWSSPNLRWTHSHPQLHFLGRHCTLPWRGRDLETSEGNVAEAVWLQRGRSQIHVPCHALPLLFRRSRFTMLLESILFQASSWFRARLLNQPLAGCLMLGVYWQKHTFPGSSIFWYFLCILFLGSWVLARDLSPCLETWVHSDSGCLSHSQSKKVDWQ